MPRCGVGDRRAAGVERPLPLLDVPQVERHGVRHVRRRRGAELSVAGRRGPRRALPVVGGQSARVLLGLRRGGPRHHRRRGDGVPTARELRRRARSSSAGPHLRGVQGAVVRPARRRSASLRGHAGGLRDAARGTAASRRASGVARRRPARQLSLRRRGVRNGSGAWPRLLPLRAVPQGTQRRLRFEHIRGGWTVPLHPRR